ncbi:MAG: DUF1947 domain-containing protein [Candidatus Baldrarchaeia archaeon]
MKIRKRHFLKSGEFKTLKKLITENLGQEALNTIPKNANLELIVFDDGTYLYMVNGSPYFLKRGEKFFPTIWFLDKFSVDLPKVVIDLGAVARVSKGADVMVPGITHINKKFKEGDIVIVVEEKHERVIAVGLAQMEYDEIITSKKGKAIRNIHHVGDKLWKIISTIIS